MNGKNGQGKKVQDFNHLDTDQTWKPPTRQTSKTISLLKIKPQWNTSEGKQVLGKESWRVGGKKKQRLDLEFPLWFLYQVSGR